MKPSANLQARHWEHVIEQGFRYTAGPIGTRFLQALANGRLMAGRCPRCGRLLMPPQAFCPHDFGEVKELVEVEPVGVLATYAVIYEDLAGSRLERPVVVGFIQFPGVAGGLVHRVLADPAAVRVGMRVRPVFRAERRGSITDIEGFVGV